MPILECDKCGGTGKIEIEEKELTLMDVLKPYLHLKVNDPALVQRLAPLDQPEVEKNAEAFGNVQVKLHGVE